MSQTSPLYECFLSCQGVSTDSRKIVPGCMYFALKGPTFDGNAFAQAALDAGAAYAVVDSPEAATDGRFLLVDDVLTALQHLARHHRRQFAIPVLGITGSNGKTTTKELVTAVLSKGFHVLSTIGNLNNQIGVPLTLLRLSRQHTFAVIEMGASKPGDIQELCDIAEPDYGLITNIGKAHLATMGGLEGVLRTKTELYDSVKGRGGLLFAHSCDHGLMAKAEGARRVTYGALPDDDYSGRIRRDSHFITVEWKRKGAEAGASAPTRLTGAYNLPNVMAAVAVGGYFGLSDSAIAEGITAYEPTNSRSEVREANGNTLILDAYNANPSSMEAAISNLLGMDAHAKAVILGEMLELGATSGQEHRAILERLRVAGLARVILVGGGFCEHRGDFPFEFYPEVSALCQALRAAMPQGLCILIKGSRGNRLELAAEVLLAAR